MLDKSSTQHISENHLELAEAQYFDIMAGVIPSNTENAPEILEKIHNEIVLSGSLSIFDSEDKIHNFLNYFSKYVMDKNSQHSGISANFVDNLSIWIHTISDNFQALNSKPEIYNQLFYLVEKVIADPHLNTQKFFYVTNTINTCITLMEELLKQGYDITVDPFVNLLNQISKKQQISIEYKSHLATELAQLGLTCLQQKACNATLVVKKFTEVFGIMVSNIATSEINTRKFEIVKIENTVQQLFKNATDKVSKSELKEIAISFIKKYSNETQLTKKCASLFNFTDCEVPNVNPITSTISTVAANQTNIENSAFFEENNDVNPLANSGVSLGAAAAHGLGSGMLNGLIHYFADRYSRNNKQASKTKIIAIYSSLFVHAAFAATFPLMLYKVQEHINQGNEEEAQRLWDNLLLQAPLTFISTAGLSLGLHVVYEYTQLLSKRFRIIAQNTLPLAGTAVGLFKNPVATGVQMAVSIIASSTTYGVFNCISPVKNTILSDVEADENKDVELKPLNTENDVKPTDNVIVGSEFIEKTYLYITKEKLDDIRNQSEGVIKLLEELVCSLEKSIEKDKSKIDSDTNPAVADTYQTIIDDKAQLLQIIKQEVENCNTEISFLNDDHKEAYKSYIIKNTHNPEEKKKIKDDYSSAMNKLGNVFKHMEPMFNNMKINLGTAHGYVKGASKSFAGDETLFSLDNLMAKIQFPLSLTKTYISTYNTWDAAEKGERNGAKKALANKENFEKSIQPTKKTRSFFNTRPQSVASDSRTPSSGSEASFVISTGSSKEEENTLVVCPLLKLSR